MLIATIRIVITVSSLLSIQALSQVQYTNGQAITRVSCNLFDLQVYSTDGKKIDQIVMGHEVILNETLRYMVFHDNVTIPQSYNNITVEMRDSSNDILINSWIIAGKFTTGNRTELSIQWTPLRAGLYHIRTDISHCTIVNEISVVSYPHPFNVSSVGVGQNTPFSPSVGGFYAGYQSSISETVQNRAPQNTNFSYVVEVIDESGYTAYINTTNYHISSFAKIVVNNSWTAQKAGTYTFKTFVLSDLISPQILSEPQNATIPFAHFCCT